jgi:hypothetical protein
LAADQDAFGFEHGFRSAAPEAGPSYTKHMPYLHRLNEPPLSIRQMDEVDGDSHSTLRIDAYQHLKEHAPDLLASISDEGLVALCDESARNSFGTVVEELLIDLAPSSDVMAHRHSMHWFQQSDGAFNAPRGSYRRSKALQRLLTSALTANSSQARTPQSWANVQHCMPLMSAANLKRTCQLLMQDLALLNRSTLVETSTLLKDVHPTAARWLMMTIARNNDTSLVALVTALWQQVDVATSATPSDFPSHVEADTLMRYYLSLEDVADDVVIGTLKMHGTRSRLGNEAPKNLLIADALAETINAKQPLIVKQSTSQTALTMANELDKYFVEDALPDKIKNQLRERLRLHACMAIIDAQNGDGDAALRCIQDAEQLLDHLRAGQKALTPQFMLIGLTRTIFQILVNRGGPRGGSSIRSENALNYFLQRLVEAACLAPSSTDVSDLTTVREYCEQSIANGEALRAYSVVISSADVLGRLEEARRMDAVRIFGGDLIADIADELADRKDSPRLQQLMMSLGILDQKLLLNRDVDLDQLFTLQQRSRLIRAYAVSHLAAFTVGLYSACVPSQATPWTVEDVEAELVSTLASAEVTATAKSKMRASSKNVDNAVIQSSQCMLAIATLMSRGSAQRWFKKLGQDQEIVVPLRLQLAYHALFTFMRNKPPMMWEYDDVVRVVKALFRLGHDKYALQCLGALALRKDAFTEEYLAVLVRGLAQIDLAKTVDLLSTWAKEKGFAPSMTNSVLAPVATQLLMKRDEKLTERFWTLAASEGKAHSLQLQTIAALSIVTNPSKRASAKTTDTLRRVVNAAQVKSNQDNPFPPMPPVDNINEQRIEETLKLWNWLRVLIERGIWKPEPALFRWIVLRCAAQSDFYHAMSPHSPLNVAYSDLAGRFLYLGAMRLGRVDDVAANAVLRSIHSVNDGRASSALRNQFNRLDKITSAMRWAMQYRHQFAEELYLNEMLSDARGSSVDDGDACVKVNTAEGTLCNALPVGTFRALILTYLRLGDTLGAASVMEWARDECKLSMEDLSKDFVSKKNRHQKTFQEVVKGSIHNARLRSGADAGSKNETLSWMSGESSVPRIKSWWTAPIIDSDTTW